MIRKCFIFFLISVVLIAGHSFASESGGDLLLKYNFITGDNGDIMPYKSITRAEVAVILAEINGLKDDASKYKGTSSFKDVATNKWYFPYIAFGKDKGYLGGYPDGTFKPDSPVTSREFAAFLMNGMGYSGDYAFESVISFAASKNVFVEVSGSSFVRYDAFEALWDAVNEPSKGKSVPIGVVLGKLKVNAIEKADEINKIKEVKVLTEKSFRVYFEYEQIYNHEILFKVNYPGGTLNLSPKWDDNNKSVVLEYMSALKPQNYTIEMTNLNGLLLSEYQITVEKQKIASVTIDSTSIERLNDYTGVIGYNVYDQYGTDVTNSLVSNSLNFKVSSSDNPTPIVDKSAGVIYITQGSVNSTTKTLRSTTDLALFIIDEASDFSYSEFLTISPFSNAVSNIRVNGVTDVDGNSTELIYSNTKTYYLDVEFLTAFDRAIKLWDIIDIKGPGNLDILQVNSMNATFCDVVKIPNAQNSKDAAFKIVFNTVPTSDTPISFICDVPFVQSAPVKQVFNTTILLK